MDNFKKKLIKKTNSLEYADLNEEDDLKKYEKFSSDSSFGLSSVSTFSSDLEEIQPRPSKRNKFIHIAKPKLNKDYEKLNDDNKFVPIYDKNNYNYNPRFKNNSSNDSQYTFNKYSTSLNDHGRYYSKLTNDRSNDRNNFKKCSEKYDFNSINNSIQSDEMPKLSELKSNDSEIDHDKLITKLKDLNIYQTMCLNELTKHDNERTNIIKNLTIENQKLIDKNEYIIKYYNNELQKLTFKLKDNSDDQLKLIDRAHRFGNNNLDQNELKQNLDNGKLTELKKSIEDEKKKLNSILEYQKEYYDQEIVSLNDQLKLKDDELTKQKKEFIGKLKNQGELFKIQIDKLNRNIKKKDDEIVKLKNLLKNGVKDVKDLETIMTSIDTEFSDQFKD